MPSALSNVFSSISPAVAKDISGIANIGSTAYNLYNQYQQQQYQNKLRELATDPAAVSKLAAGYTAPLNAGLQKGVANEAQAYLAQRGLTDSPQISQQVEAQAIAPYIQQNQQQGYDLALRALGLGGGAIPPALQQQNGLAALTKAFSQLFNPAASGAAPNLPTLNQNSVIPNPYSGLPATPPTFDPGIYEGLGGGGDPALQFSTASPDVIYQPDYLSLMPTGS